MDHISPDESLSFFLATLGYLDEKYVNGSDEDLKYFIFEELDIDAHTFLHNYTVDILVDENLIPDSIVEDTYQLRTLIVDLIERKRTLDQIRFDDEWKIARLLAQKILSEIKTFQDR